MKSMHLHVLEGHTHTHTPQPTIRRHLKQQETNASSSHAQKSVELKWRMKPPGEEEA